MRQLQAQNAAEVSSFLVIASRLLQIKSAALLPRPSLDAIAEEEENSAEALAQQLLTYKRFKELAAVLTEREASGLHTYLRIAPPTVKVEARLDLSGVTLQDLVSAARDIFYHQPMLPALSRVVSMPRVTIREKIRAIVTSMRKPGQRLLSQLPKAARRPLRNCGDLPGHVGINKTPGGRGQPGRPFRRD
jgi:segregation and condensation protein A